MAGEHREEQRSVPVRREDRSLLEEAWEPPLSAMRRVRDDMDRVLSNFGFPGLQFSSSLSTGIAAPPAVDVWETKDAIKVRADLPGIDPNDIEIYTTPDSLVLRGEARREEEGVEHGYYRAERRYGRFERAIPLPVEVAADKVTATFKNGTLDISLPKTERAKEQMKKVPIEVHEEQTIGAKGGESKGTAKKATKKK